MTDTHTASTTGESTAPVVELVDLGKTYANGVHAVRGVSLAIAAGEVHALVGENGAGKSTVMKLVYGLERPTSGTIRYDGQGAAVSTPRDAIALGVGMVHQNLMLVPSLTIAENIALGAEPGTRLRVDREAAVARARQLSAQSGLTIDPEARVHDASVGMRQRTEILKALGRDATVLILDEPTAVLTPQEADEMFTAVRRLRDRGLTVIFISHKLDEVLAIADRVSVMRQGRLVGTWSAADCTTSTLASAMVGRDVDLTLRTADAPPGPTVLSVEDLRAARGARPPVGPLSFTVRAGEIVGIAGIEDNGQNEVLRALAGLQRSGGGTIRLNGVDVTGADVARMRDAGVAHVPEDRLSNGAALDMSIADNLIIDRYRQAPLSRRGWLRPRRISELADRLMHAFSIKAPDPRVPVGSLSGGNMQKVIVARELSSGPKLILAEHPTRGVDIGAMEFIYERFATARDDGAAVLLISADLTELLELSDRLLVIRDGQLVGHFHTTVGLTEDDVGRYMLGVDRHDAATIDWSPA